MTGIDIFLCAVIAFMATAIVRQYLNISKLMKYIQDLETTILFDPNQTKDEFLKFVSDSRDWAFEYIEQVQTDIKSLTEILSVPVEKISAKKRKSADDLLIVDVYKGLMLLLPSEDNN